MSDTNIYTKSILNPEGFGISNGISTILALQAGFLSMNTPKLYVIGALISLLITDPLSDAYSIYISMKDTNNKEAYDKFLKTLAYQGAVKLLLLIIVVLSPSLKIAFILSIIIVSTLILYDYINCFKKLLILAC